MQDQPAKLVEVMVMRDRLTDVPILFGGTCGVELLELDAEVDDRLQQVERADGVRHHRLVRAVPRFADVRLGAEVEYVRLVRRRHQVPAHQVVDRRLVGEVGEDHVDVAAVARDVVQRARRRRAYERDHVGAQRDQRVGEVRAHESVRAGDEARAVAVEVAELDPQRLVLSLGPGVGKVARHRWRIAPTPAGEPSVAAC